MCSKIVDWCLSFSDLAKPNSSLSSPCSCTAWFFFIKKNFFNIVFVCVCERERERECVYEHLDACLWSGLWAPFERDRFIWFCMSNALMKCLLNWKGLHGLKVLWGNPVYIINLLGKFFLDNNKIQFLASLCPNLKFHLNEAPSSFCESVAWCHQSCLYFFSKCSWEDSSLQAGSVAWSVRSIGPESGIWPAGSPHTHKPRPVPLTQVSHCTRGFGRHSEVGRAHLVPMEGNGDLCALAPDPTGTNPGSSTF